MRALITGGAGQLAADFHALLGEEAVSLSRDELDIADALQVALAVERAAPDVILNCAAFHNLDLCESEPDRAWEVNVRAVRGLARTGVPLVHLSTNYVFDGRRSEPYAETDVPAPRSVYAITKLAGEHAALAYGSRSLVVRTAGLYGLSGSASKGGNFVQRMVARAKDQGSLRMVADQTLQPTFTADLAAAILDAVSRGVGGTVHVTAADPCSWFEFTEAIVANAALDVPVEPAGTTVAPGGVDRPLNGVLARPVADQLGIPALRGWREQLDDYMQRAGQTEPEIGR